MSGFDAGAVVKPLDYLFHAFGGPDGTVPEPTDAQLETYSRSQAAWRQRARSLLPDLEDVKPADFDAALLALPEDASLDLARAQTAIYADLCSGTPSPDDLMKLPRRIRFKFYQWLDGELSDPEAVAGGGNAQVVNLRSSAAG